MAIKRKVNVGRRKEEVRGPSSIVDVDLISKLPDDVIHHILSFLPTIDAFQTSLLSRHWRRVFYSVPTLAFSDEVIDSESFNGFVEHCLKRRKIMGMDHETNSFTRFKIKLWRYDNLSQLDKWLEFAAHPHLRELDLTTMIGYRLPRVSLTSASLTVLSLEYARLEASYPISLPSLKSLSLTEVEVEEEEEFHKFFSSCPSLEKLFLKECYKLYNLRLSSSRLKLLDVSGNWETIQVEAINLETFEFLGHDDTCHLDIASCKKITKLILINAFFSPDMDIKSFISGLPLLESLEIFDSDLFDIQNQHLKFFYYRHLSHWDEEPEDKYEISVDAPNLFSFDYCGVDTSIGFSMKNSPNLMKTNITLWRNKGVYTADWYNSLFDFLSYLKCSKTVSLDVYN